MSPTQTLALAVLGAQSYCDQKPERPARDVALFFGRLVLAITVRECFRKTFTEVFAKLAATANNDHEDDGA